VNTACTPLAFCIYICKGLSLGAPSVSCAWKYDLEKCVDASPLIVCDRSVLSFCRYQLCMISRSFFQLLLLITLTAVSNLGIVRSHYLESDLSLVLVWNVILSCFVIMKNRLRIWSIIAVEISNKWIITARNREGGSEGNKEKYISTIKLIFIFFSLVFMPLHAMYPTN